MGGFGGKHKPQRKFMTVRYLIKRINIFLFGDAV